MHRGYVKLYRKGLDHALFSRPLVWHFWNYCLLRANHKDCEIEFQGKPLQLKRGSFVTSLRRAADDTGLSVRNIRSAIKTLCNFSMLEKSTHQVTRRATIISVINYATYQQASDDPDTVIDTAATQQRHSSDTAATIDKNVKNTKKVKNVKNNTRGFSEAFERWWKSYPERRGRKVGKKAAAKLFEKISKNYWDDLRMATKNYSEECNGLPKDAERFLKNNFWKDFITPCDPKDRVGGKPEEKTFAEVYEDMKEEYGGEPIFKLGLSIGDESEQQGNNSNT